MMKVLQRLNGTPFGPETLTIHSDILEQDRRIYVQQPASYSYATGRHYPLLVVLDGEWIFELARAHVQFFSQYQAIDMALPEMFVVGIENIDRDPDYVPTPDPSEDPIFPTAGHADRFLRFLRDELFPLLEREYRLADSRAVVGWSFGGLCALHSALTQPELFQAYLCIGPAVWWGDERLIKQFEGASFECPKRLVITLGADENPGSEDVNPGSVYTSTKALVKNLHERPIPDLTVTHLEFEGEGHSWSIPTALSRGLRALFPNYRMQLGEETTLEDIEAYYAALSSSWGFDAIPPGSVLLRHALALRESGKLDRAIDVLDWYLQRNTGESLIHGYKGIFSMDQGRPSDAAECLRTAICIENQQPVPNHVYLRGFKKRLREAKRLAPGG